MTSGTGNAMPSDTEHGDPPDSTTATTGVEPGTPTGTARQAAVGAVSVALDRLRAAGSWLYRISDRALGGAFAAGVLSSPFYRAPYMRAHLLGTAVVPALCGVAVLCLLLALAWRSVLRRDFVWLQPADLTWTDATDARVGRIGGRLWAAWVVRFGAAGYVAAVTGLLIGGWAPWLAACTALFAGVALFALVFARRAPGVVTGRLATAVTVGLAVLAVLASHTRPGPVVLWVVAGAAVVGAVGFAFGSGRPRRPRVATGAGRDELVERYRERVVRRVSATFGDALALLPPARPIPVAGLLSGRAVVARFVLAGVLSRARSMLLPVLLVVAVTVLHRVFPQVTSVWWIGAGGYLAAVPFAATLAQLCEMPGLRRWLGCSDLTLRLATAAVVVVVIVVWGALAVALGVPVSVSSGLAAVVAAGAVVRTVSRPALDYGNIGVAATPDGNLVPVGLILQLVHGPELLVVGLVVAGLGLPPATAAVLVLAVAAFCVLR